MVVSWLSLKMRAWSEGLQARMALAFVRLTFFIGKFPKRTIALCLLGTALCSIGWSQFADEDDPQKLFVPQETRAIRDRDFVEERFPDPDASSQLFLNRRGDGANVMTRESLRALFDLHEDIELIDSESSTRGYDERSCALIFWDESSHTCQKEGVLSIWNWNRTAFEADDDIMRTLNEAQDDCCSPFSRSFQISRVAAKIHRDENNQITSVGALRMAYYLRQSLNRKTRQDPHVFRLEKKFDAKTRRHRLEGFERGLPLTSAGVASNVEAALDYDRLFVTIAFVTITFYAFFSLHYTRQRSARRGLVGLLATLVVGCSVAAAFGLCFAFGVQFSPISSVSAFLVLGIGLDDTFVIIAADDMSTLEVDKREVAENKDKLSEVATRRICLAMASAGPSITTTSITDFAAFLAGSLTEIPAISGFCIFCAVCVIIDFVLQVTLLVAILILDTRSRLTKACADESANKAKATDKDEEIVIVAANKDDEGEEKVVAEEEWSESAASQTEYDDVVAAIKMRERHHSGSYKTWWGRGYARMILSPVGVAFVILVTSVLIVLAGIGASRFTMDFEYRWLFAEDLDYDWVPVATDFQIKWFPDSGAGEDSSPQIPFYTKRADYFQEKDAVYNLIDTYSKLSYIQMNTEDNWFVAHEAWSSSSNVTTSQEYLDSLHRFIETDGEAYADYVVFDRDDGEVVATKFDAFWEDTTVEKAIDRMQETRRVVKDAAPTLDPIVYTGTFPWLEGLRIITAETVRSLAVACSVVVVVLVALLGDLAVAALVSAFVCTICLCTVSSIYWYGDNVNFISAFFIIIAAGLATDASAHVAHAFIHAPPSLATGRERARYALDELGGSVFKGILSTLVGISVIAGTTTYVFQSFWQYLTTIMVLALWFGLAVAPVTLSLLGPFIVAAPRTASSSSSPTPSVSPDDDSVDAASPSEFSSRGETDSEKHDE